MTDFTWMFLARTGEGVDSAGEIMVRSVSRLGYGVVTFREFPSVIKGGMTSYEVRITDQPKNGHRKHLDLVIAGAQEFLSHYTSRIGQGTRVMVDDASAMASAPLSALAATVRGKTHRNAVALGISAFLLGIPLDLMTDEVRRQFRDKGESVVESNLRGLEAGYQWASEVGEAMIHLPPLGQSAPVLSGNEAMAVGALMANCRLFFGYPITPASDILEWLARELPAVGGAVVQAEDEIAALMMVIGAQYAGVRAMTATSGPGLSLMTESLGYAAMTETPAVIVDTQRPGPSAGMPTKHEQGDLAHMIYAGHGDFGRIVLAPIDPGTALLDMPTAFNLAERYQCPVIVASDQDLALSRRTLRDLDFEGVSVDRKIQSNPDDVYARYWRTEGREPGPRILPGTPMKTPFVTSGDEHDTRGGIDVEDPEIRAQMQRSRWEKLDSVYTAVEPFFRWGQGCDHVYFSVGSSVLPLLEWWLALPPEEQDNSSVIALHLLSPFPTQSLQGLKEAGEIIVVEQNYSGQVAGLLAQHLGIGDKIKGFRKYDGMPITVEDLWVIKGKWGT